MRLPEIHTQAIFTPGSLLVNSADVRSNVPMSSGPPWGVALVLLLSAGVASAGSSPVVPWLDVRPAKAPANPPLAPPCWASDLHAHLFLQGATGSLVGGVELLNAGTSS